MGLFGPKIPKEEKRYQKALKEVLNKPNTKNIMEMKEAVAGYPAGWQGYWICALYHDQGFDKSPVDEVKANEYFQKAENAAKGTEDEVWMRDFMTWYRRPAGNTKKPLTDKQKRMRRMGVAMCYCYLCGDKYLTKPYEKYGADGYVMSRILDMADVDYDDRYPFSHFVTVATFDHNEQTKHTNRYLTKANDAFDQLGWCLKRSNSGQDPKWDKYQDMYNYFLGINAIHGGDLLTGEVAAVSNMSEVTLGIGHLGYAAIGGCQPAIHELVRLAKSSEGNYRVAEDVFKCNLKINQPLDAFLLEHLEECIRREQDEEAVYLAQKYYADLLGNK